MNGKINFSKVKVLGDWVIARPWVRSEEIGGIILPASAREDPMKSTVACAGPGWLNDDGTRDPMRVKAGDVIYHSEFAGTESKIKTKEAFGEKYLIMHETDIFGLFVGERPIDLELFGNRVLLEWETAPDRFTGTDLVVPEGTAKERYYTGVVLAKGPKAKDKNLRIGKRVFWDQYCSPKKIEFNEKRYAVVKEHDIACVIPERAGVAIEAVR